MEPYAAGVRALRARGRREPDPGRGVRARHAPHARHARALSRAIPTPRCAPRPTGWSTGRAARGSATGCARSTTAGASAGMARGAIVVILSDGWDRGEPDALAEQMARLARVAYKIVWVNPLKASPGYAPLAQGMAAALPLRRRVRRRPFARGARRAGGGDLDDEGTGCPMKEVLGDIARWQAAGQRAAIARVVGVEGSSPREAGAAMAVNEASEVAGSVSGGCVEGAVVEAALEILARRARAGRDHVRLLRRGRVLGRAHVRRHDPPVRRAGRRERDRRAALSARCESAIEASEPVALVTVIDGARRRLEAARAARRGAGRDARQRRPRSRRRPRRARRARGRAQLDPPLRRARRGARRSGVGVHRVVRRAAPHDHLRRGRLHRRAREGRRSCSASA